MAKFKSYNPATADVVWEGSSAEIREVDNAVKNGCEAFESWSNLSLQNRIEFLHAFRDKLSESKEALAKAISEEIGKPLWESIGEVGAMINKVNISIDAYDHRCKEIILEQATGLSITRHKPHGVVAVFGPFNFPGHLPNGHIVPALLAGNTVVFKPSELAPLVAELTVNCWEKAGLPKGVLNLIQGGRETGQFLADHPKINGLFFTGSWQTGLYFLKKFADTPEKILALEMGGNNPLVLYETSNLDAASYCTIQSAFLTSGQRCTCARRLIIPHGSEGDDFLQILIKDMKGIKVGPYTNIPEPFMGPVRTEAAAKHLLNAQNSLLAKGGKILVELTHLIEGTGLVSPGLMDVTNVLHAPDEEIFGPFLQVIRVNTFDEAIQAAKNTAYGLSAGIITDKQENYEKFYQKIRAGIINWNTPTTGASSSAPFGGVGHSGNHRPSAYYAADYCSFPVASLVSPKLTIPNKLPPGLNYTVREHNS